jgi:TadE-like protein
MMKRIRDLICGNQGQSMVEFAIGMPFLLIMMFSIIYVSKLYIVKEKTLVSARYGAWKLSRNKGNISSIKNSIISNYFPDQEDRVNVKDISGTNSFNKNELAGIGQGIDKVIEFISEIFSGKEGKLRYGVEVTYSAPIKLGMMDLAQADVISMDVTSKHFIDGNTWEGDRTDVHEVMGMLWNLVKSVFGKLADL